MVSAAAASASRAVVLWPVMVASVRVCEDVDVEDSDNPPASDPRENVDVPALVSLGPVPHMFPLPPANESVAVESAGPRPRPRAPASVRERALDSALEVIALEAYDP